VREAIAARAGATVQVVLIAAGVVLLAIALPRHPELALGAAVLLLVLSFTLAAPSLLLAIAFVAAFAYWRVGPTSVNISVCDTVTVLALIAAVPYVPWKSRALRRVLGALCVYLALIAIAVAAHPTRAALLEWPHRAVLVGGAVLIGAAVARRGETAIALRAYVLGGAVVAIGAIYESLTTGFSPAFPFGMHKNAAGSFLAIAVIIMIVAPVRPGLRARTIRFLRILCIVGLAATQARGAALALVAAIAIYAIRNRRARQRAPIFFLVLSVGLIVASVVTLQEEVVENPQFNAIDTRRDSFDIAINDVWLANPIVGGGLRWFQEGDPFNPGIHNVAIAELSEVGVIGFVGLLILMGNLLVVLNRQRTSMGELALLVLVFLLLFSFTGILWAAGAITITMLVVGLAVGESPSRTTTDRSDSTSVAT
jgi:O-antigen ligase